MLQIGSGADYSTSSSSAEIYLHLSFKRNISPKINTVNDVVYKNYTHHTAICLNDNNAV